MNTLKFGNGEWYGKKDTILAYNDENSNFKPLPFSFDRASSATVINKDGLIETVGSGEPRIDYKDDSKGALLLEPSRTNLITYSEDFSNAAWNFKSNVNLQSGMLSPKGDLNAYKITATTTDNSYIGGFLNQNTDKYKSIWARTVSGNGKVNLLNVRTEGSTNGLFNLSEEWTRFEILHDGVDIFYGVDFRNSLSTLNEIIIYGAQLEQGSYATSYIPTQGGAVTRVADAWSQTVPSGVIGQTEGTILVDVDFKTLSGTNMFVSIRPDASNKIEIYRSDAVIYAEFASNASFNFNKPSVTVGRYKIAVAYSSGSSAMYINGVLIGSNTTSFAFTSTLDDIYINSRGTSFIEQSNYNDFKLYNTRLSNAELQALTSN